MENQTALLGKVQAWVEKEGVPLEYFTAHQFVKAHYNVFQGRYVNEAATAREIDVIAFRDVRFDKSTVRLYHIVECKWSKEKPWVVFTSPNTLMAPSAVAAQTIGSEIGQAAMWHCAGEKAIQLLPLFQSDNAGFGGRQVLSQDRDLFYQAIQSLVTKSLILMGEYNSIADRFSYVTVGFPVLVLEGKLINCSYDHTSDRLQYQEATHSRIHWRGSNLKRSQITVDVVTKEHLEAFLEQRAHDFDVLAQHIHAAVQNIQTADQYNNMNALDFKSAPRGIGMPKFLQQLHKRLSGP